MSISTRSNAAVDAVMAMRRLRLHLSHDDEDFSAEDDCSSRRPSKDTAASTVVMSLHTVGALEMLIFSTLELRESDGCDMETH